VSGSGGGPEKTILNSPRWLRHSGYRALCAYLHPPNDPGFERLRTKACAWNAPLISIPDRGPWDMRVLFRLGELCRRERVAIWHGQDYKSNALGLLLRQFWPMELVTTVHGWVKHTRRTPLYYAVDRHCLPRYSAVICVSDDLQHACRTCGVPEDKCVLIENAIDLTEYSRTLPLDEAKRQLGFRPDRLIFGAIGRLSDEKGFDLLIRAFGHVLAAGVDAELVIAGEGDEHTRLEAQIAAAGLLERVHLLGYRSDALQLYQALDVFVLSSLREGLPNVVLEAMALDVPAVATRVAGLPRLIRDGENGLLVEPGSVPELAQALVTVAHSSELRSRLAAAGRATVEANHSFERRMQKIAALYDTLLDQPRGRRGRR
jgi:glycosyltransferase involved in cell wall biosynthesis